MTSARRPLLLLAVLALFAGLAAWLVLRPLGVFDDSAGPLDGLLAPDVDAAVRFDPGTLALSSVVETLRDHPGLTELRAATGLDDRVLAPLRDLEDRVGRASLGLAPSVERDVLGQEAVIAVRGEDVLLLSRLTGRGKLLDAATRLDPETLRAAGLRVEGGGAVLERAGAPAVHLRRVRDVLVASTSPDLVATAAALAEPPEDVSRGTSVYSAALGGTAAPGARVFVWANPRSLPAPDGGDDDVLQLVRSFFPPEALDVVTGTLDLGERAHVALGLKGGWQGEPPAALGVLSDAVGGGADGLLSEAERFAVPGEAFVTAGLAVRAADAVRALADAQPPARRELVDDLLAERGLTVDVVAERIAAHLRDGVAAVVSRLPEADALELDDPRSGGVHPIPATLVAFRLRDPDEPDAVVAELASEAEALFGAELRRDVEEGPGGARIHVLAQNRFGGEWALLRPAVAVVDGLLVFCTHDAHLRRALAQRERAEPVGAIEGAQTVAVRVDGHGLRRHMDDRRWAWADRATWHDWRAEREAIRRELDASGSRLLPRDRQVYEDERIARRLERRNAEEFPAAIARYRERWRPLEVLDGLLLRIDRDGSSFRLALDVELAGTDAR